MIKPFIIRKLLPFIAYVMAIAALAPHLSFAEAGTGDYQNLAIQEIPRNGADNRHVPVFLTARLDVDPEEARSCANSVLRDYFSSVLQQSSPSGVVLNSVEISVSLGAGASNAICALGVPRITALDVAPDLMEVIQVTAPDIKRQ